MHLCLIHIIIYSLFKAGAVHIFLSSRIYTTTSDIVIHSKVPAAYEHFGSALEYSSRSEILLVGAPGFSSDQIQSMGCMYVFKVQPQVTLAWIMRGSSKFQQFGSKILLDESKHLVAVSSPSEVS